MIAVFNLDQETVAELVPTPTASELHTAAQAKLTEAQTKLAEAQQEIDRWNPVVNNLATFL